MPKEIVNLHGHDYFSLLDGMTRPNQLVDYTLKMGQDAACVTNHGVMYGIVDLFQYAQSMKQKAIAGFEAYVVKNHTIKDKTEVQAETENRREHLVLLAKDNEGYKRITKMCSIGCTDGFYYRPRIDDKIMEDVGTKGVIGMSACLAGRIAQNILKDRMQEAEKWAIYYYKLFNGDFYLELQPTIESSQIKVNLGLIEIHKKTGIPVVATSDFHYLKREDASTHDVLLAMQSRSLVNDPKRWKFPGDTFFVMTREEMTTLFNSNGHEILDQKVIEQAMDNTSIIASQCNVHFDWDKHYLPKIDPPADNVKFNTWASNRKSDGSDSADYLKYLCIKGLKEKQLTTKEYRDRLDFELNVINDMGFPDYFLIFEDIMKFCRENDIPVGPARGCAREGEQVILSDGAIKAIEDVKIGETIIGHDEKVHEIIDTLQYDCKEELVTLEAGENSLTMTKDHEVYGIKKEDFDKGIREPKWYKMDQLNEGDYLCELD
jgi:DNA polymerase-3 subunit alpha